MAQPQIHERGSRLWIQIQILYSMESIAPQGWETLVGPGYLSPCLQGKPAWSRGARVLDDRQIDGVLGTTAKSLEHR